MDANHGRDLCFPTVALPLEQTLISVATPEHLEKHVAYGPHIQQDIVHGHVRHGTRLPAFEPKQFFLFPLNASSVVAATGGCSCPDLFFTLPRDSIEAPGCVPCAE